MLLTVLAVALAAEPAVEPLPDAPLAIAPFGIAQMVWKAPVRGAIYAVTQAAGLGVGIYSVGQFRAEEEAGNLAESETWQGVAGAAVGTAVLSYAVSLLDGSKLAEERAIAAAAAKARREGVTDFDRGLAMARAGGP